ARLLRWSSPKCRTRGEGKRERKRERGGWSLGDAASLRKPGAAVWQPPFRPFVCGSLAVLLPFPTDHPLSATFSRSLSKLLPPHRTRRPTTTVLLPFEGGVYEISYCDSASPA